MPKSRWETPPRAAEEERAIILGYFQMQTQNLVMANLLDIVAVDKLLRKATVPDVDTEIESAAVPVVSGALGAVTCKLRGWLQQTSNTWGAGKIPRDEGRNRKYTGRENNVLSW